MIDYNVFNAEVSKSIKQGSITNQLGEMVIEMCHVIVYSWVGVKNKTEVDLEEYKQELILYFCERFLKKADKHGKYYTFAVTMLKNRLKDMLRKKDQMLDEKNFITIDELERPYNER